MAPDAPTSGTRLFGVTSEKESVATTPVAR